MKQFDADAEIRGKTTLVKLSPAAAAAAEAVKRAARLLGWMDSWLVGLLTAAAGGDTHERLITGMFDERMDNHHQTNGHGQVSEGSKMNAQRTMMATTTQWAECCVRAATRVYRGREGNEQRIEIVMMMMM